MLYIFGTIGVLLWPRTWKLAWFACFGIQISELGSEYISCVSYTELESECSVDMKIRMGYRMECNWSLSEEGGRVSCLHRGQHTELEWRGKDLVEREGPCGWTDSMCHVLQLAGPRSKAQHFHHHFLPFNFKIDACHLRRVSKSLNHYSSRRR